MSQKKIVCNKRRLKAKFENFFVSITECILLPIPLFAGPKTRDYSDRFSIGVSSGEEIIVSIILGLFLILLGLLLPHLFHKSESSFALWIAGALPIILIILGVIILIPLFESGKAIFPIILIVIGIVNAIRYKIGKKDK